MIIIRGNDQIVDFYIRFFLSKINEKNATKYNKHAQLRTYQQNYMQLIGKLISKLLQQVISNFPSNAACIC